MAEAVVVAGAIEAVATGTPPFKESVNWVSLSGAGPTENRDLGESSSHRFAPWRTRSATLSDGMGR